jgi:hypothetical protein
MKAGQRISEVEAKRDRRCTTLRYPSHASGEQPQQRRGSVASVNYGNDVLRVEQAFSPSPQMTSPSHKYV